MEKVTNLNLQESYYIHQLENGLQIIIFHKPEFVTTTAAFATPYGALDFNQIDENGVQFLSPAGIAHFLEHKMFESEKGDIMTEFSALGANVNAFTSYTETVYYFSTSNEEIETPLTLLLDFVQKLEISEESVEKEKGIIAEELNMYLQLSDTRLIFETLKNMYHNHPLSVDIGGSVESIYEISKEYLTQCHQLNYHPSKMLLIVAGPTPPESIIEMVEKNQKTKVFKERVDIERLSIEEPFNCVKEFAEVEMEINQTKLSVSFKLNISEKDLMSRHKMEWALRFLLDIHFSPMSQRYQQWLDEKKINDYFGYEISIGKDFGFLIFYGEQEDEETFKQFIFDSWCSIKESLTTKEELSRLKRRYFGHSMMMFNQVGGICFSFIRTIFSGIDFFDSLSIIQEISMKDIQAVYDEVDLNNHTVLKISKNK